MLMVHRVTPRQIVARMAKGDHVTFVDARGDEVRRASGVRLTGAVSVGLSSLVRDATRVSRASTVVVYGRDERDLDVPRVADALRGVGFSDVRVLAGGFTAWLELRYPVQPFDEALAA